MKREFSHILLEESDMGFPRLTTMRRRLEDYDAFAQEIYQKLMKEYGFVNYPQLFSKYIVVPTAEKAGCSFFRIFDGTNKISECHIRINITNARLFDSKTYNSTIPHEVAHIFQGLVDLETWKKDGHGELFFECADIICGYFPYVTIAQFNDIKDFETYKTETLSDCRNFQVGKLQG